MQKACGKYTEKGEYGISQKAAAFSVESIATVIPQHYYLLN